MEGTAIVSEIVEILTSGIVQLGQGIGAGIANFAQALAFTTTGTGDSAQTHLSVYFVLVIVFAGVSLARILVLLPVMALAKLLNCWKTSRRQSAAKPGFGNVQRLALCA